MGRSIPARGPGGSVRLGSADGAECRGGGSDGPAWAGGARAPARSGRGDRGRSTGRPGARRCPPRVSRSRGQSGRLACVPSGRPGGRPARQAASMAGRAGRRHGGVGGFRSGPAEIWRASPSGPGGVGPCRRRVDIGRADLGRSLARAPRPPCGGASSSPGLPSVDGFALRSGAASGRAGLAAVGRVGRVGRAGDRDPAVAVSTWSGIGSRMSPRASTSPATVQGRVDRAAGAGRCEPRPCVAAVGKASDRRRLVDERGQTRRGPARCGATRVRRSGSRLVLCRRRRGCVRLAREGRGGWGGRRSRRLRRWLARTARAATPAVRWTSARTTRRECAGGNGGRGGGPSPPLVTSVRARLWSPARRR